MNDAVSITRDLVRCASVTPADAGALGVLENILKSAGFEVHRVTFSEPGTADIDNLYARIGERAPHISFAGHTDVVPGTLPPRPLKNGQPGPATACAVIVKRVDERTRAKTSINELLRD